MYKGFKVIDADAHMQPPGDIWDRYTEQEFYDRRPMVHQWENKMFHHFAPCELYPEGTGPGRAGGGGRPQREGAAATQGDGPDARQVG